MELFALCIKVFLCRIVDMSLASIRTVYTVKGKSLIVAGISIVEGLVYFLIITSFYIVNLYLCNDWFINILNSIILK